MGSGTYHDQKSYGGAGGYDYNAYRRDYYNYYHYGYAPRSGYGYGYYDELYRTNPAYKQQVDAYYARLGYNPAQLMERLSVHSGRSSANGDSRRDESFASNTEDDCDPSILDHESSRLDHVPQPEEVKKFSRPHPLARFCGTNGLLKLVPTLSSGDLPPPIEIHSLKHLFQKDPQFHELQAFPGPLVRSETHKNDVIQFCTQRIQSFADDPSLPDRSSHILLWELLVLMLRQNGFVSGSDIAELLLRGHEILEPSTSASVLAGSSRVLAKFREFLLFGHKKDALEWAVKCGLWGHALSLASKMDARTYAGIMTRFTNALAINDPLQTLYQHLSGRQPAAVTCIADEKWGDWRPHLAMILSNPSSRPEVDARSITTLGDVLASRGCLSAAHFCYLMAQVEFGTYACKSSKMVLLGSSHQTLSFEEFATNEAIQCTEIYEYSQSLANAGYMLPHLQTYKFLHATRLAEYGFAQEALHYCEVLAEAMGQGELEELGEPPWLANFAHLVNQLLQQLRGNSNMSQVGIHYGQESGYEGHEAQPVSEVPSMESLHGQQGFNRTSLPQATHDYSQHLSPMSASSFVAAPTSADSGWSTVPQLSTAAQPPLGEYNFVSTSPPSMPAEPAAVMNGMSPQADGSGTFITACQQPACHIRLLQGQHLLVARLRARHPKSGRGVAGSEGATVVIPSTIARPPTKGILRRQKVHCCSSSRHKGLPSASSFGGGTESSEGSPEHHPMSPGRFCKRAFGRVFGLSDVSRHRADGVATTVDEEQEEEVRSPREPKVVSISEPLERSPSSRHRGGDTWRHRSATNRPRKPPLVFGGTFPIDEPVGLRGAKSPFRSVVEGSLSVATFPVDAFCCAAPNLCQGHAQHRPAEPFCKSRDTGAIAKSSVASTTSAAARTPVIEGTVLTALPWPLVGHDYHQGRSPQWPQTSRLQSLNGPSHPQLARERHRWLARVGWGGIFGKLLPKGPNQMILPDDKDPDIVWDEQKKCWVDKNAAPGKPSPVSSKPGENRFQLSKQRSLRKHYVDVLNPNSSKASVDSPSAPAAAAFPEQSAAQAPVQFFVPQAVGDQHDGSSGYDFVSPAPLPDQTAPAPPPPPETAPTYQPTAKAVSTPMMFDPADFSSRVVDSSHKVAGGNLARRRAYPT
ncbi:hypothetical protein MTO96_020191 [Rhipicephalus appendiculatus]